MWGKRRLWTKKNREPRYKKELEEKKELLEKLRHEARKGTVTLLYSAKDTEHNNAVTMKEVLG